MKVGVPTEVTEVGVEVPQTEKVVQVGLYFFLNNKIIPLPPFSNLKGIPNTFFWEEKSLFSFFFT